MTKEEYAVLLRDPRWILRRNEILRRDEFLCQGCFSMTNLHVHHKYYKLEKMPWEYPDEALVTLCDECHLFEHERPPILRTHFNGIEHISAVLNRVIMGIENGMV